MDELIIRVLSGAASSFEEERLKRWRSESPENEAYYLETARVWDLTAPEELKSSSVPPVDAVLRAAEFRTAGGEATRRKEPIKSSATTISLGLRRRTLQGLALAATVAAIAFGLRATGMGFGTVEGVDTFSTGAGESRTITLSDGSFVRLAPDTRLYDRSTAESRRVELSGRAFFAVTHDPDRPFTVETAAGAVRVLGTRFELAQVRDNLRTVVVEGRVAVSNENGSVEVTRGSVATVTGGQAPTWEVSDDVYSLLDWPGGILVFQSTPLGQAAEEVSRHFGRILTVHGKQLEERRITAWFGGESFAEIAESLCIVSGAECTPSESGVTMRLSEEGETR